MAFLFLWIIISTNLRLVDASFLYSEVYMGFWLPDLSVIFLLH